jgi:hypothetical protein
MNQNLFHKEIKTKLNLAYTHYHSVQSISFSIRYVNIKIHKTVIYLLFCIKLVYHIMKRTKSYGVCNQSAVENIWARAKGNNRRLEKYAQ